MTREDSPDINDCVCLCISVWADRKCGVFSLDVFPPQMIWWSLEEIWSKMRLTSWTWPRGTSGLMGALWLPQEGPSMRVHQLPVRLGLLAWQHTPAQPAIAGVWGWYQLPNNRTHLHTQLGLWNQLWESWTSYSGVAMGDKPLAGRRGLTILCHGVMARLPLRILYWLAG